MVSNIIMSKFDSILKNYLTENDSVNPAAVADQIKNLKPEEVKDIGNAFLGQPRNDGEKVLHVLATNPDINHIEDAYTKAGVTPDSAQKDLMKMGLNTIGNNPQKTPQVTPAPSAQQSPTQQGGNSIQG
jgi:hypothetical protein